MMKHVLFHVFLQRALHKMLMGITLLCTYRLRVVKDYFYQQDRESKLLLGFTVSPWCCDKGVSTVGNLLASGILIKVRYPSVKVKYPIKGSNDKLLCRVDPTTCLNVVYTIVNQCNSSCFALWNVSGVLF